MASEPPPTFAWLVLACSVLAVSSAGAVFQLIDQVPPLLRASWRLQGTALLLLPPCLIQLSKLKKTMIIKKLSKIKNKEDRVVL